LLLHESGLSQLSKSVRATIKVLSRDYRIQAILGTEPLQKWGFGAGAQSIADHSRL